MRKPIMLFLSLFLAINFTALSQGGGTCAYFDGTDDYLTTGGANYGYNTITTEFWAYATDWTPASTQVLVTLNTNGSGEGYKIELKSTGIRFYLVTGDASSSNSESVSISTSNFATGWHHIAATYDGSNMNLWVDGETNATIGQTGNVYYGSQELRIGTHSDGSDDYDGYIDELRFWRVARSQAEIQSLMHTIVTPVSSYSDLRGYYRFESTTTPAYLDNEGNASGIDLSNPGSECTFLDKKTPIGDFPTGYTTDPEALWRAQGTGWSDESTGLTLQILSSQTIFTYEFYAFANNGLTGTSIVGLPTDVDIRALTIWFLDDVANDRSNWNFDLSDFGASAIEVSGLAAANYKLLKRTGTSGDFSVVVSGNSISSGKIYFEDYTPSSDAYYTIGRDNDPATVITTAVSSITSSTANSGGNVTADGGGTVTAKGVCWSTSTNPTIANSYTTDGSGTGSFTSNLTGLFSSTSYYVRAYATNSEGTSYGNQESFTTSYSTAGNALDFDGYDDYVLVPDITYNNITIETWIYRTTDKNTWEHIYSDWYDDGENNRAVNMSIYDVGGTAKLGCSVSTTGGGGYEINGTSAIEENVWYHVAMTYDGDTMKLFLNGVKEGENSTPSGSIHNNAYTKRIASRSTGTTLLFPGKMDEFRIWNSAKTETEIIENMCQTLDGNEPGLVAYYRMNETSGANVPDISGNGNDGTATNMDNADWVSSTAFNTWLNVGNTSWTIDANWSLNSVPVLTDNVGIPNHGGSHPVLSISSAQVNNLVVGDGVTLSFSYDGSHTIHGNVFNIGTTNLEANTDLTITGSLYMLHNSHFNIKALADLTIDKNLHTEIWGLEGYFTIESTEFGTGSLIVEGTSSGDVTMQRHMEAAIWTEWDDGWHFLSAPVSAQAIDPNFTSDPYDFYCWREYSNEWVNFKNNSTPPTWATANVINNGIEGELTANFKVGKGYMAAYDEAGAKSFSGELNLSDVNISGLDITGEEQDHRSWHLLGNPYSSGLTWDASWTKSDIGTSIQIWKEAGPSYTVITAAEEGVIPATNGFMVQATADGASLTIPKGKRVHGGSFYKNASFPIIKLKANNLDNQSFQESQLLFIPESTQGYESEYDCDYLPGYAAQFYSKIGDLPMAVNSMPECNESLKIPFTFDKNEGQNFSIEMYEEEGMLMNVWLLDRKNSNRQNLSENPVYVFTAFEGDEAERFEIQFGVVGIEEQNNSTSNIQIWAANKCIHILNPDREKGTIRVINMYGQMLAESQLNGNESQELNVNVSTGNYIVSIVSRQQTISKKVFVK
jgi:concanavalin A-like lectin/glucanase superfamily protein